MGVCSTAAASWEEEGRVILQICVAWALDSDWQRSAGHVSCGLQAQWLHARYAGAHVHCIVLCWLCLQASASRSTLIWVSSTTPALASTVSHSAYCSSSSTVW